MDRSTTEQKRPIERQKMGQLFKISGKEELSYPVDGSVIHTTALKSNSGYLAKNLTAQLLRICLPDNFAHLHNICTDVSMQQSF